MKPPPSRATRHILADLSACSNHHRLTSSQDEVEKRTSSERRTCSRRMQSCRPGTCCRDPLASTRESVLSTLSFYCPPVMHRSGHWIPAIPATSVGTGKCRDDTLSVETAARLPGLSPRSSERSSEREPGPMAGAGSRRCKVHLRLASAGPTSRPGARHSDGSRLAFAAAQLAGMTTLMRGPGSRSLGRDDNLRRRTALATHFNCHPRTCCEGPGRPFRRLPWILGTNPRMTVGVIGAQSCAICRRPGTSP